MRNMLERVAAEQKIRLRVAVETNSMQVQRRLAATGTYYTVLPSIAVAEDIAAGTLVGAPLTDRGLRRRLLLALPGTRPRRSRRARGGRTARRGDAPLRRQRCLALGHLARQNITENGRRRLHPFAAQAGSSALTRISTQLVRGEAAGFEEAALQHVGGDGGVAG